MEKVQMIEAIVLAKHKDGTNWEGMGKAHFKVMPRVGEYIAMDIDEVAHIYKVVAIHHPLKPASTVGDIFVVYVGSTIDEMKRLWAES